MTMIYSNPARENENGALPDVEVFQSAACPECGSRSIHAKQLSKTTARIICDTCTATGFEPVVGWYWRLAATLGEWETADVHGPFD